MSKLILLCFLLFILKETCGQSIDPADYPTYSKVLNAFLKQEQIKKKMVVLKRETEIDLEITENSFRDSTSGKLINNLGRVNKEEFVFAPFELKNYHLTIVSIDSLDQIFEGNGDKGWAIFNSKYPNSAGIVCMSKMYLSSNMTSGIIYIEITRGSLRGAGYLVFFNLLNKKIIERKECLWVS